MDLSLNGDHIIEGKLEIIESSAPTEIGDFAERNTLEKILVTSVTVTGTDPAIGTVDVSFTLNFQKIHRTLKDLQNNGTYGAPVEMKWDYAINSTF